VCLEIDCFLAVAHPEFCCGGYKKNCLSKNEKFGINILTRVVGSIPRGSAHGIKKECALSIVFFVIFKLV